MKNSFLGFIGAILFILGLITSVFGCYLPEYSIFLWITLFITLIYLFSGWYLFKSYFPAGNPVLLFFMGYFYSGVFLAATFSIAKWPFAETMIKVAASVWIIAQIVLIVIYRKKIPAKGLIHLIVEVGLLGVLTVFLITRSVP
jgi:hypothetical protein